MQQRGAGRLALGAHGVKHRIRGYKPGDMGWSSLEGREVRKKLTQMLHGFAALELS